MGVRARTSSFRINSGKGGVLGRADSDVRISRGDHNAEAEAFLRRAPNQGGQGHGNAVCTGTEELVSAIPSFPFQLVNINFDTAVIGGLDPDHYFLVSKFEGDIIRQVDSVIRINSTTLQIAFSGDLGVDSPARVEYTQTLGTDPIRDQASPSRPILDFICSMTINVAAA